MKKLICAAIAALALAPLAYGQGPAPTTPPISAPATGGVVTTTTAPTELVKRAKALAKPADRLTVLGLLASGKFPQADSTLAALEAAAALEAGKTAAAKEVAAEYTAKADSLQRAESATLKPMTRTECVDWAADGATAADKDLRLEALRIRWRVAEFPKSVTDFGNKVAWLVSRGGPSAGGGNSAEVAVLRKKVEALEANTIAALRQASAETAGLRRTVVASGTVSEAEVAAAVDEMLRTTRISFDASGDETSPGPDDGARVVLKAGD